MIIRTEDSTILIDTTIIITDAITTDAVAVPTLMDEDHFTDRVVEFITKMVA